MGMLIDITVSGYSQDVFLTPNGNIRYFRDPITGKRYEVWHDCGKIEKRRVNVMNIESFMPVSYPVVEVNFKRKKLSWWKRFLFSDTDITYDIDINDIGVKNVTILHMVSGNKLIVDQTAAVFEKAFKNLKK